MKKIVALLILSLIGFTGCTKKPVIASTPSGQPPLVVNARDTLAAASGFVANAQKQYAKECVTDPTQEKCKYINQAVSGINATITAEEAYCGWSAATASQNPQPPCVPVATAADGLNAAIANLTQFVNQLKGAIQ
jgi:hypothetical protein